MTEVRIPVAEKPKSKSQQSSRAATPATPQDVPSRTSFDFRTILFDFVLAYMYYFLVFLVGLAFMIVILSFTDQESSDPKQVIINVYKTDFHGDTEEPVGIVENYEYVPFPLSDDFIKHVNSKATTWKAGRNFPASTSMKTIARMMGVLPEKHKLGSVHNPIPLKLSSGNTSVPSGNFDGREEWPQCPSLKEIRDQGGCGSCWAFGAVEAMTDRHCITHGTQFRYSAEDILTCCNDCGYGCDGGWPAQAFRYWLDDGIVSGGAYESHQGCQPYEIPACEHHVDGPRPACGSDTTPKCERTCIPEYNSTYEADKHFSKVVYGIINETDILYDLRVNGPMEGSFTVYEDFLHYQSGVYQHVDGQIVGGHAVKVIGYGVENDVPYYLCSNSWNYDWGMGGFFKIARNEMDSTMYSGIPDKRA